MKKMTKILMAYNRRKKKSRKGFQTHPRRRLPTKLSQDEEDGDGDGYGWGFCKDSRTEIFSVISILSLVFLCCFLFVFLCCFLYYCCCCYYLFIYFSLEKNIYYNCCFKFIKVYYYCLLRLLLLGNL